MASKFIGIMTLMEAEALAGFAMPARASAFNTLLLILLLNIDALAGIAKPSRATASISASIPMNDETVSGFVPKGLQVLLAASS